MTDITLNSTQLSSGAQMHQRREKKVRRLLLAPSLLTILIIGVLPLSVVLIYSFLEPGSYGGVKWHFSVDAYVQLLFEADIFDGTLSFTTAYLEIFWRSISLAVMATVGCLLVGFPTAYFIATQPPERRNIWLFLITIPFWTNLLIRTYAMLLILRDEGVINIGLQNIGVIDQALPLLYTEFAVSLGLIYSFLPFMVLPIYSSMEKFDFRLVEAGFDLYANRLKVLWRIIVPIAKPGIAAGCILVFIPSLGAYITPEVLGGGKSMMIGNLIHAQFGGARNWPFGAAIALILMAVVLISLWVYMRRTGEKGGLSHG